MADLEKIIIETQEGPQRKAELCDADILVFGGAAGGGKSRLAVHNLAKFVHVKDYGGIIFRRTSPELTGPGSVWSEMGSIYPLLGGEGVQGPVLKYTFPSGTVIEARHLQHDKDVRQHQSKAYARIVFDEATHFSSEQFWFLLSRMRTTSGVKKQFLLTCNPDPDSFILLELIDWWIGPDGYPIPERDGVKRWFVRSGSGEMTWADTREGLLARGEPMSVTFISSKLTDNRKLMEADPAYMTALRSLPPVLQARMLGGNWRIREGAGDMFQRGWFPVVPATPLQRAAKGMPMHLEFTRKVRWWDRAATPFWNQLVPGIERPADFRARREGNPDWTRGLLGGLTRARHPEDPTKIVLLDMVSWRDAPGAIEEGIIRQALADGPGVIQGFWVDPAQAGLDQAQRMKRLLNKRGIQVVLGPQVKSKREYASLPSQLAYNGGIWVMSEDEHAVDWLPFWNELEAFPPALGTPESKKPKDDQVDVLSGLCQDLDRQRKGPILDNAPERENPSIDHRFFEGEAEGDEWDEDGPERIARARTI